LSGDSWLAVGLLVSAFVVLAVATAAEAGVVFISRLRVRAYATRGLARAASLETYVQERHALLGTLAVARDVSVVLGIAVGTFLVLREAGHTWVALGATMAVALLALAGLEALSRLLVANSPERWGLRLVPAMGLFRLVFGAPARMLDAAANAALRRRGDKELPFETVEDDQELLRLVEMHEGNGGAENGEMAMIRRIANMVDRAVREIMTPRIDMVVAERSDSLEDVLRLVNDRGYSRIPIYEETVDNIVGVVYAKDILKYLAEGRRPASLAEIARPPYFVPEGKHVYELLTELREHKVHMAIVVDEYGGTAGLVTIEDVLEEIVGEIQDEYDREEATIQRVNETEAVVDARVTLDDLNEAFDSEMESEDVDTVGGFVYHQLGRMPAPGDEVHADGLTMRVLSVAGRRINKVRVTKNARQEETEREEAR
jgi:CBS domain containing-hemolysin-like protein